MIIEEIKDVARFSKLEEDWNNLLSKSSIKTVFSSHQWHKCWWEAYGKENELFILICKDGGRPVGISPLMISKDRFRGFPITKISFIENDETPHCAFLMDGTADPSAILATVFDYLRTQRSRWDILWLEKIPENTAIINHLKNYLEGNEYKFIIATSLKSPFLEMDTDWDTFYSEKPQRFKKKIRYDNNKLKKQGDFEIEKLDRPEEIESHMKDIFHVGYKSWKEKIRKSIGSTPENQTFFSTLPRALTNDRNGIVLWTLRFKGEIIAFEYHVREKNIVYALRGEFNEIYSHLSPGSVLDFEIVRNLFENNYSIYNMGGSPDRYKLRWTSKTKNHLDIIIFNRKAYCSVLYFLENNIKPIAKTFFRRPN